MLIVSFKSFSFHLYMKELVCSHQNWRLVRSSIDGNCQVMKYLSQSVAGLFGIEDPMWHIMMLSLEPLRKEVKLRQWVGSYQIEQPSCYLQVWSESSFFFFVFLVQLMVIPVLDHSFYFMRAEREPTLLSFLSKLIHRSSPHRFWFEFYWLCQTCGGVTAALSTCWGQRSCI